LADLESVATNSACAAPDFGLPSRPHALRPFLVNSHELRDHQLLPEPV